ncbi:MAG TPA: hypothetical protein PLW65_13650 [Pseudomonadota bacterium]|nr:hypothetical protein [Pseudomonadota bacterium]
MPDAVNADRELFQDDYIVVRVDADGLLVWLIRSSVAYPDIAALMWSFEGVIAALDRAGRSGRVMLFDTRAARGRNDPEFESAMAALRPRIERQFVRVGVLVASAVGALQMRRWVSADGIERVTGTSPAELATTLRAELAIQVKE